MITNDRQYKIAKAQIDEFRNALENLSFSIPENVHPKLINAHKDAIKFQLNKLLDEIKEYEYLKEGKVIISSINNLNELPMSLIKARISNNLTQAQLAEKLGMKMQQIQRYEAEKYESASLKTLKKIADILNIKLNADIQLKMVDDNIFDVNRYPFRQMFKRNWFGTFLSYNDAVIQAPRLLQEFFANAGLNNLKLSPLNKRTIRSKEVVNEFALNAWYAQVLIKAKNQHLNSVFCKDNIDELWFKSLAQLSSKKDGPIQAAKYVQSSGIKFIIEPVLEGTKLDGAALLDDNLCPVIAMTLRYDRLDNFWFVLFHELAHVVLHLNKDLNVIFDDLDNNWEGIEREADDFALNALVPDEFWRKSLVRFNPSPAVIRNEAHKLKIHPAILAGKIRRETGKYFLFQDLIGQGEVRYCFNYESYI